MISLIFFFVIAYSMPKWVFTRVSELAKLINWVGYIIPSSRLVNLF
jgi:hypothetical protein